MAIQTQHEIRTRNIEELKKYLPIKYASLRLLMLGLFSLLFLSYLFAGPLAMFQWIYLAIAYALLRLALFENGRWLGIYSFLKEYSQRNKLTRNFYIYWQDEEDKPFESDDGDDDYSGVNIYYVDPAGLMFIITPEKSLEPDWHKRRMPYLYLRFGRSVFSWLWELTTGYQQLDGAFYVDGLAMNFEVSFCGFTSESKDLLIELRESDGGKLTLPLSILLKQLEIYIDSPLRPLPFLRISQMLQTKSYRRLEDADNNFQRCQEYCNELEERFKKFHQQIEGRVFWLFENDARGRRSRLAQQMYNDLRFLWFSAMADHDPRKKDWLAGRGDDQQEVVDVSESVTDPESEAASVSTEPQSLVELDRQDRQMYRQQLREAIAARAEVLGRTTDTASLDDPVEVLQTCPDCRQKCQPNKVICPNCGANLLNA